ncbi:unnamed protein product [Parnassius mnemosyne]|uniref:PiggyBac transposable element-derived protein domain-containing protein n=1 Tax=Parnassius mnemosyne TaxID=213953 RepID=A0AAV1K9P9_9NEOP
MLVGRYRPHGHIRYLYLAFCRSRRLLSTTEIAEALEALEEVEDIQGIDVYIYPPCNDEISDGDLGEEDCCDFDILNRHQLLVPVELVIHTSKDDQHVEIEAIEPEISSPAPAKTLRMPKKSQPDVTISNEQLRQPTTSQDRPSTSQEQSSSSTTSSWSGACPLLQQKPRRWTKRDLNIPQNVWVQPPPRTVLTLSKESEPLEFFELFFSEDVTRHLVRHSVIYAVQQNPNTKFTLSGDDIYCFLGILILSGYVPLPRRSNVLGNK